MEYRSSKSKERQSFNYGPKGKFKPKERKHVQVSCTDRPIQFCNALYVFVCMFIFILPICIHKLYIFVILLDKCRIDGAT